VIVGAEAVYVTETSELSSRARTTGRLSVDVAVDTPVDQASVRVTQCPSLTPCRLSRNVCFQEPRPITTGRALLIVGNTTHYRWKYHTLRASAGCSTGRPSVEVDVNPARSPPRTEPQLRRLSRRVHAPTHPSNPASRSYGTLRPHRIFAHRVG